MFFKPTSTAAIAILCALAQAAPSSLETVALFNGKVTTNVSVGKRSDVTLVARDSYDCKGSSNCGSGLINQCLEAARYIDPNHVYNTFGGASQTGVCSGHCGIFVQGGNCDLRGQEMIDGIRDIRNNQCQVCGSKRYPDGCLLTINYVTGCP